ncbi:hypothetical protein AFEL58S_02006 [Afipia felis]
MATQDLLGSFGSAKIETITPALWDLLLRTIEVRLAAIEAKKVAFEDVVKEMQAIGLARINEALLPAFNEIAGLAHLGAIFTAQSATTAEIGAGQRQFTIAAADRDRFAPTAYLMVRANDETYAAMLGGLVGYDRPTGTLTVAVDSVAGVGSFASWTVMPSLAPDLGHEARRDNPHHVTAEQVGAILLAGRQTITGGFVASSYPTGSLSGGTFKPDPLHGNVQHATNDGAHAITPPDDPCSVVIQYTNGASAGALTTSGFSKVTGASYALAAGNKFLMFVTRSKDASHLHIQALQ